MIIKKLINSINERHDTETIDGYINELCNNITDAVNEPILYTLPFDQITNIMRKVDFGNKEKIKDPFALLQTIIHKTSEVYNNEAVLLLNYIKIGNLYFTIDNIISVLSRFTNSELLTKLGEVYSEEKNSVEPDYSYEIEKLKRELQQKNKEIEEFQKPTNELANKVFYELENRKFNKKENKELSEKLYFEETVFG